MFWIVLGMLGGLYFVGSAIWLLWVLRNAPEEEWPGQYG